ncbi:hypothetical protein GCM10011371_29920 [Novosphingobium marinum]|uniref:VOC domain-containing protein n=1 Tax=Novosphingobium marinum TaxID=1514948 RepID=A0A7Y9XY34_9SPHN|nr:VOC family protein [Novosphingobium marinum]NYH96746.1 hypothetical protein [Novosphingobium marinum]GGC40538.1 hypothetical protein GCM10011371_29920 [Novosphingobium marinum]
MKQASHPLTVRQLGYVVGDLELAATRWIERFGAGPFHVLPDMRFDGWSYMGRPQEMTLDIAFGQAGPLMVELIVPRGEWPSVYGSEPPARDEIRAHHHGILCADIDGAAPQLGAEMVTSARLSESTELRYFDCRHDLGLFVELITDSGESRAFFDLSEAARKEWDGHTAPIRDMPAP